MRFFSEVQFPNGASAGGSVEKGFSRSTRWVYLGTLGGFAGGILFTMLLLRAIQGRCIPGPFVPPLLIGQAALEARVGGVQLAQHLADNTARMAAFVHDLQITVNKLLDATAVKEAVLNASILEAQRAQSRWRETVYIVDPSVPDQHRLQHLLQCQAPGQAGTQVADGRPDMQAAISVNLTELAESRAAEVLKARVAECYQLRCSCQAKQKMLAQATQVHVAALGELAWRTEVERGVAYVAFHHPWFKRSNLTMEQAIAKAKADPGHTRLIEYVRNFQLYQDWWTPGNATWRSNVANWRTKHKIFVEAAEKTRRQFQRAVDECNSFMAETCGIQLERATWKQEAKVLTANQNLEEEASGTAPVCTALKGDISSTRSQGLAAPFHLWKWDPLLYPGRVNVSFVLYASESGSGAEAMVSLLHKCMGGSSGKGQLKGTTSEMIVVVEDMSGVATWLKMAKSLRQDAFLTPIFLPSPSETRGYNRGASMARGDIVIMLKDDLLLPANCSWVADLLRVFEAWPRMGMVGLRGARITQMALPPHQEKFRSIGLADDPRVMRRVDPLTGINMRFVGLLDSGPIAYRRTSFMEIGGIDEAISKRGEHQSWVDYQTATRMWLAGFQVSQMFVRDKIMPQPASASRSKNRLPFVSHQNDQVSEVTFQEWVQPHESTLLEEVMRLNRFLATKDVYE